MSTVAVALIVAVIAPSVLAFLQNRLARGDKREDYARLDLVAARAEEAARLVGVRQDAAAAQAREAARLLVETNAAVAETAGAAAVKLDVIHALVNSSYTAALQSEYDATVRNLAMMKEIVELHRAAGQGEPAPDILAALKATQVKISELNETLIERHRQDDMANAQTVKIVAAEGLKVAPDQTQSGAAVDNPPS